MEQFDSGIRTWFAERFGAPTAVQAAAWPRIAAGEHVLATAPTGCGKTLAALLWSLDRFATGAWDRGGVRVLYISPLKALNTDVRENLLEPLAELRARGVLAAVDVQVRSGDTPQADRQRMLRRPPEILVTTPESLNLLLASPRGRSILTGVETVILDEIHAVAGNKRGTYLMTAVERLVELAGEFQRVALSATVEPLDTVAAFVGGVGRRVSVVRGGDRKSVAVRVCGVARPGDGSSVWPALVPVLKEIVAENRSTLFFVNNRSLAERLARMLNADEDEPVAYAHHGSLARELRTLIESKLKSGALRAVVATSSLELGIDVGALDEVVLVQAPPTTNSAIQRIGRAGHAVGETSRGRIFPTFGRDVLDAAVIAPLVLEAKPSPVRPVHAPLDVLAQVLVAMCGVEPWAADDLYAVVRRTHSYRDLGRAAFDGVVAMLRGRYQGTRLRELRPRLRLDPETGRLYGVPGVLPLLYGSGGVIPDRGLFTARVEGTGARLGELDEEFVWERRIGDVIAIGTQTWRVVRITKSDVEVVPAESTRPVPPFWRADAPARDFELCDRIGRFVQAYEASGALPATDALDATTRESLATFLHDQKVATDKLPHRFRIVIEHFEDTANNADAKSVIIHAGWGARCLRPLAIALAAAWEQEYGFPIDVQHNNDALVAFLPHDFSVRSLLDLVHADNVESLLRGRLERTGFFGARFRENAGRALLLPRMRGRQRMPLWVNRLRAKKLLAAVQRYDDFPVLAETWRACLEDEFDLTRLKQLLDEVRNGTIEMHEAETKRASPFAEGIMWRATERHMYDKYEVPLAAGGSALSDDVLREVLHDESGARPQLARHHTVLFEAKLQRTAPGYEPTEPGEWVDHVAERVLVRPFEPLPPGLVLLDWGRVAAPEQRARIERARAGDEAMLTRLLAQFLEGFGPLTAQALEEWWQLPRGRIVQALAPLVEERRVVAGRLHEDADVREFCDAENLERLLRMTRAAARPAFRARPKRAIAYYLAQHQRGDLRRCFEALFGYPAPAALWEDAILPARVDAYEPSQLDTLFTESDLLWFGAGERRCAFAFADELPLFREAPDDGAGVVPDGHHEFFDLAKATGLSSQELAGRLWQDAWAGRATNDTFAALRKGIETKFKPVAAQPRRRARWQSSRPMLGRWHRLPYDAAADRLVEADREKSRARQLLARYGVLFRELCAQELPLLRWGRVLRALRLLELSGEALAGHFFDGIDGLQFASAEAFRALHREPDEEAVFWLNACDPASLCGAGLADGLPPRVASTWLVYRGTTLVLVARRNGREIERRADPDDRALCVFDHLLKRGRVKIETIDGTLAIGSVHADLFIGAGFRPDVTDLVLERTYA